MKDSHVQTPKNATRHAKSVSDHAKKNQKIVKKSLNAELSAVSEDVSVFESPKNLTDFAPIFEISELNLISEPSEDLTASLTIEASPGSVDATSSVLTPPSSTVTYHNHDEGVSSISQSITSKPENLNLGCIEAELVVKHLKEAQLQLFSGRTMDLQYKKLLDALINVIIKEIYGMPEEEGYTELIPRKAYLAFLSFLLLILAATVVIIFSSDSQQTFYGNTPT